MTAAPTTPKIYRNQACESAELLPVRRYFSNPGCLAIHPQYRAPVMLTSDHGKINTSAPDSGNKSQLTTELESRATIAPHQGPRRKATNAVPVISRNKMLSRCRLSVSPT